jgi:disulfide bond formation protein DsbB
MILNIVDDAPRKVLLLLFGLCLAGLGFGLYLQHVVGLNPCPMCIVQRYALLLVGLVAGLTAVASRRNALRSGVLLCGLLAVGGAFVAARQSFLQWYPPEVTTCGRDFYGMIETFPLQRAVPMIFKGSGDCSAIDWTFLGGTLANWSFVVFSSITLLSLLLLVRSRHWIR